MGDDDEVGTERDFGAGVCMDAGDGDGRVGNALAGNDELQRVGLVRQMIVRLGYLGIYIIGAGDCGAGFGVRAVLSRGVEIADCAATGIRAYRRVVGGVSVGPAGKGDGGGEGGAVYDERTGSRAREIARAGDRHRSRAGIGVVGVGDGVVGGRDEGVGEVGVGDDDEVGAGRDFSAGVCVGAGDGDGRVGNALAGYDELHPVGLVREVVVRLGYRGIYIIGAGGCGTGFRVRAVLSIGVEVGNRAAGMLAHLRVVWRVAVSPVGEGDGDVVGALVHREDCDDLLAGTVSGGCRGYETYPKYSALRNGQRSAVDGSCTGILAGVVFNGVGARAGVFIDGEQT